jgi:hypothetical protein
VNDGVDDAGGENLLGFHGEEKHQIVEMVDLRVVVNI